MVLLNVFHVFFMFFLGWSWARSPSLSVALVALVGRMCLHVFAPFGEWWPIVLICIIVYDMLRYFRWLCFGLVNLWTFKVEALPLQNGAPVGYLLHFTSCYFIWHHLTSLYATIILDYVGVVSSIFSLPLAHTKPIQTALKDAVALHSFWDSLRYVEIVSEKLG